MAEFFAILAVVAMVGSLALLPRGASAAETAKNVKNVISGQATVSGPIAIKMLDPHYKITSCDKLLVRALDSSGNVLAKAPAEGAIEFCRYSLRVPADTSFTLNVSMANPAAAAVDMFVKNTDYKEVKPGGDAAKSDQKVAPALKITDDKTPSTGVSQKVVTTERKAGGDIKITQLGTAERLKITDGSSQTVPLSIQL